MCLNQGITVSEQLAASTTTTEIAPPQLWHTIDWVRQILRRAINQGAHKRKNLKPVRFEHQPQINHIGPEREPCCIFKVKLACGVYIHVAGVFSTNAKHAFTAWCRSHEIFIPVLEYEPPRNTKEVPSLLQKAVEHLRQLIHHMVITLTEQMDRADCRLKQHLGRFSVRYCQYIAGKTEAALVGLS